MTVTSVARGREMPRKTLHLTTSVVPLALWMGLSQRTVAAALILLFGIACAVELARRRSVAVASRFDATVGAMLREHEVTRGITGATWLLAAFALTVLVAPLPAAIAATWAGAIGDGSAAIVGSAWRRARGGAGKSAAGSVACVITTAVGAWWLAGFGAVVALTLGLVAASVERPSVALDDNVRVTIGVAMVAALLLRI
jgi:dolichol kinase